MKKVTLIIMLVGLLVSTGLASYTYEVYTYGPSKSLIDSESILVAEQGGMNSLTLGENSSATILGTSVLGDGTGGIWEIDLMSHSSLNMSDGQVNVINISNDATAYLSGGLIQQIWSGQNAWKWDYDVEPPVQVPNPHITIECLDHLHNTETNVLTGHWLDGSAFSIQLIDVGVYSPAIENIRFIPEPATLILFGFGGLLLRRKR